MRSARRGQRGIGDPHSARLAVELEEDRSMAVVVGLADGAEAHHHGLAALEIDGELDVRLRAIEENRRRQIGDIGVRAPVLGVVDEDLRIHQV